MWNLKQIPKVAYLWWGKNKPLSYMHFKTVESFSKMNPDWKIKVFYPTQTCTKETWETGEQKTHNLVGGDHFPYLTKFDNVEVKSFDMEDIGFSNDMPEVFKSDIIRLYLLKEYGGVWSDFDIIYTKPMSCLLFNKKENQKFESFICDHYYFNSVGFLMSAKGSDFYNSLFEECKLATDQTEYQSFGRDLFRKVLDDLGESEKTIEAYSDSLIYNMPFEAVYPYAWNMTDIIFGDEFHVGPQSIGCHWYAGSEMAGEIASSLEENIDLPIIQCMENIQYPKLAICLPLTQDRNHTQFMDSFVKMKKPDFVYCRPQFPANIDAVRNQLVEQAINAGCHKILMLDTDQDYPEDLIYKLSSHEKTVVGAAVCRRYPPFQPILYRGELGKYTQVPDKEIDGGGLVEVAATGCGAILYDIEVFLHIDKPWFEITQTEDGKVVGEDIGFCAKLKAAGYDIFVDCDLDVGHYANIRVDRHFAKLYHKILNIGKE